MDEGERFRPERAARAAGEAAIDAALRGHRARMAALDERLAAARAAQRAGLEAVRRRMDETFRRLGGRPRPGRPDRGDDEGGAPVPAVPKPHPNPLSGAAAASIEE
jgi:hypothetical protein